MGLAARYGFADLESPLPQAGLDQLKRKFTPLRLMTAPSAQMSSAAFRAASRPRPGHLQWREVGKRARLILKNESWYFVMLETLPPTVCPVPCLASNNDHSWHASLLLVRA
jgi:hypothetical protein